MPQEKLEEAAKKKKLKLLIVAAEFFLLFFVRAWGGGRKITVNDAKKTHTKKFNKASHF